MRRALLCFLLIISFLTSFGQTATLRGRVLDAETGEPIPNAPVGVARNRIGTTTNLEGRFAIVVPAAYQGSDVEVNMIGYEKQRQKLPLLPGPELVLRLRPRPAALGEVTVSGSVLGIVREAVARIPQNYPVRPTRLEGFFRESDNSLTTGKYEQLGEAVLSVYKAPYTEPGDDGDVVVEQSRRLGLAGPQKLLQPHWYAGPFIPHRFDFVHNRLDFINEKDFKNYDYKLEDLTTYDGYPVYVIGFGPKPGNNSADFAGQLFIDQDSYAFLAGEWHRTPAGLRHEVLSLDAEERAYRADYQQYAGRWHLRQVWYNTLGSWLPGRKLRHLSEFLTTAIDTAQHPRPPYVERAQFRDVFQDGQQVTDSAFWKSYTTLVPPEQLRTALRDQERQQRAEELFAAGALPAAAGSLNMAEIMAAADSAGLLNGPDGPNARRLKAMTTAIKLLRRFHFDSPVGVLPVQATAARVQASFAPPGSIFSMQGQADAPTQLLVMSYGNAYSFDLTKHLAISYRQQKLTYNFRGRHRDLGLVYELNLRPRHRPIYLQLGAAYTWQRLRYGLGKFDNPDGGLRVAGTRLGADEIRVSVQQRLTAWQPRLGLALELSHHFRLVAEGGYLLGRGYRHELYLEEKSGFFLFRNDVNASLPRAGASVSVDGNSATLPWQQNRLTGTLMLVYRAL